MELYRAMFYCNAESDRDPNFIKAESLRIELIAGGLNWKQQDFIMDRLQPNAFMEVSFRTRFIIKHHVMLKQEMVNHIIEHKMPVLQSEPAYLPRWTRTRFGKHAGYLEGHVLQISFLDYLCYVPLFLSMHENIVDNPLDMRDDKYDHMMRKASGGHRQRDMNPLGKIVIYCKNMHFLFCCCFCFYTFLTCIMQMCGYFMNV